VYIVFLLADKHRTVDPRTALIITHRQPTQRFHLAAVRFIITAAAIPEHPRNLSVLVLELGDEIAEITVLEPRDQLPDDIIERPLVKRESAVAGYFCDYVAGQENIQNAVPLALLFRTILPIIIIAGVIAAVCGDKDRRIVPG
jgi:hypothetical protein